MDYNVEREPTIKDWSVKVANWFTYQKHIVSKYFIFKFQYIFGFE